MTTTTANKTVDIEVSNHGTIFLVQPLTDAGSEWLNSNVQDDAQWFGSALVVEHGYIGDLVAGMQSDGLEVA